MKSRTLPAEILVHLSPEEATAVLRQMLEKHPELSPEIETMANERANGGTPSVSIDDVAEGVYGAVTGLDIDLLYERAGNHSWGYVDPGDAAEEFLETAVEDWVKDMNQHLKSGLVSEAAAVCAGIVAGLHKAGHTQGNGVLGWAPDFPAEHAENIVEEFLRSSGNKMNERDRTKFLENLADQAPKWATMFSRY